MVRPRSRAQQRENAAFLDLCCCSWTRVEKLETPIDPARLNQLPRHTAELACAVIDTIANMDWQFPGSNGPGDPILDRGQIPLFEYPRRGRKSRVVERVRLSA